LLRQEGKAGKGRKAKGSCLTLMILIKIKEGTNTNGKEMLDKQV